MPVDVKIFGFMNVRKKPVQVEAVKLDEDVWSNLRANGGVMQIGCQQLWSEGHGEARWFAVGTLEGVMMAEIGDWLIKGVNGEIYSCKSEIFEKTYDIVG